MPNEPMTADEKQVREKARKFCLSESADCPHVQAAFASDDIIPVKPSEIIQFMADFALCQAEEHSILVRSDLAKRAEAGERAESALAAAHEALRGIVEAAELEGWDTYRGTDAPRTGFAKARAVLNEEEKGQ